MGSELGGVKRRTIFSREGKMAGRRSKRAKSITVTLEPIYIYIQIRYDLKSAIQEDQPWHDDECDSPSAPPVTTFLEILRGRGDVRADIQDVVSHT